MAGSYTTCVRVVTVSVSEVLLCECDLYELDRNIIFKDFFCFFCLFVCLFLLGLGVNNFYWTLVHIVHITFFGH